MIKETELRIGNIVNKTFYNPNGSSYFDWSYFRAEEFKELEKWPDIFQPVPITEEWLKKFGFVFDGWDGYKIFIDEDKELSIYFEFENEKPVNSPITLLYYDAPNNHSDEIKIWTEYKSVHSLQNLYFALTGNELTIKE